MRVQRGTCDATLTNYGFHVRELLKQLGEGPSQWNAHLRAFLLENSRPRGLAGATTCTTALRMFVRFLIADGQCAVGLDAAIPTLAHSRLAALPRYLQPDDVERVIASCDPASPAGAGVSGRSDGPSGNVGGPSRFYKIILRKDGDQVVALTFLLPSRRQGLPLPHGTTGVHGRRVTADQADVYLIWHSVSIEGIEHLTGLRLLPKIEATHLKQAVASARSCGRGTSVVVDDEKREAE